MYLNSQFKMNLPNIFSIKLFCLLVLVDSNISLSTHESQTALFLKPQNLSKQVKNMDNILEVSKGIANSQKKINKEFKYLPHPKIYLKTSTRNSAEENYFSKFLSSALYAEFTFEMKNVDTSQVYIYESLTSTTNTIDNRENFINCSHFVPLNETENAVQVIKIPELHGILKSIANTTSSNETGVCTILYFYAKSCRFSVLAAPHFNVFSKMFPQMKMLAVEVTPSEDLVTAKHFGVLGTPSLMLFQNGQIKAKHNRSDYSLDGFTQFIFNYTDLPAYGNIEITIEDFANPEFEFGFKDTNYPLWLAWFVIIGWSLFYLITNRTRLMNNWMTFRAQHEHVN